MEKIFDFYMKLLIVLFSLVLWGITAILVVFLFGKTLKELDFIAFGKYLLITATPVALYYFYKIKEEHERVNAELKSRKEAEMRIDHLIRIAKYKDKLNKHF